VFEDIDVSAFNGKHRPAFTQMMERLDETDAIVFLRFDRLSRSSVEAGQIAEACKAAGVNLVATDMNTDTTSAGGRFVYTVLAAAGEMEAGTTSERSEAMMAYKRKQGEWVGKVPFGWTLVASTSTATRNSKRDARVGGGFRPPRQVSVGRRRRMDRGSHRAEEANQHAVPGTFVGQRGR
jgi:DNA invertase Pin-like site-specific DNA recombinase